LLQADQEPQMSKDPVRILVADDFEPFRGFIRSLFQQRPDFVLVGEVSDGLEALRCAQELQPEVIILDIALPRLNGIQAAREIRSVAPESNIVFVTLENTPEIVLEAFRVGACGYILKSDAFEILTATDCVRGGEKFVSSGLLSRSPNLTRLAA
jgi:DNA-binding NarL/FixJ family response regulator